MQLLPKWYRMYPCFTVLGSPVAMPWSGFLSALLPPCLQSMFFWQPALCLALSEHGLFTLWFSPRQSRESCLQKSNWPLWASPTTLEGSIDGPELAPGIKLSPFPSIGVILSHSWKHIAEKCFRTKFLFWSHVQQFLLYSCLEFYDLLISISIQLRLSYLFQTVNPYQIEIHRAWMDK